MKQSSFRFHKFKENEKTSSPLNYNKNLSYNFSSYNNSNNDIFQNSNKLSRSIYFGDNQQNNIFQNKNKNERIIHLDESNINLNSPFPEKEILKIEFENILNHGDLKEIENYLPNLLYNKFDKSKGMDFLRITTKFQILLQFLFKTQSIFENVNNNSKASLTNLNSRIEKLNKKKNKNENIEIENDKKIKNIQEKILILKHILISNRQNDKNQKAPFDFHDEQGNYYCENCPNKIFTSYDEVYKHYISEHNNNNNLKRDIVIENNNFQQFYFEKKLNNLKNEINTSINQLYDNNYGNQKIDELKKEVINLEKGNQKNYNNLRASITQSKNYQIRNSLMNSYINNITVDDCDIELNNLLQEQENQFKEFHTQLRNFQIDIFKQIKNISENKDISIPKIPIVKNGKTFNISYKNGKRESKEVKINKSNSHFKEKISIKKRKTNLNNLNNDNNNKNPDSNYNNEVIKRGTNILIQNNLDNIEEVNDDEESESNKKKEILRGGKKKLNLEELSNLNLYDLRKRFNERDQEILMNEEIDNIEEVMNEDYNFLNLDISSDNKNKVQKKINEIFNSYNIKDKDKLNSNEYNLINLIEHIVKKNNEKQDEYYSDYRDNLFSLNKIEDILIELNLYNEEEELI